MVQQSILSNRSGSTVRPRGASIETLVDIRLGRDREQMMEAVLKPNSTVVLGGSRGWWPAKENRMAKRLERAGHHVLFAGGSL